MQSFKILLPADLRFSAGVREFAQEAAILAGFSERQKNMLKLVIDEIFMNAIRYGSSKESTVLVEAVIDNDKVIVAIEDEGKNEKSVSAAKLQEIIEAQKQNTSLEKVHGRGLAQITSTQVDAFDVSDKEGGGLRIEFMMQKKDLEENVKEKKTIERSKTPLVEKQVKISGSIDLSNFTKISEEVEHILATSEDLPLRMVFDFSDLEYCNSSFLGQLAHWQTKVKEKKGECVIKNPTPSLFEILDLVGLTNIFIIENNA